MNGPRHIEITMAVTAALLTQRNLGSALQRGEWTAQRRSEAAAAQADCASLIKRLAGLQTLAEHTPEDQPL